MICGLCGARLRAFTDIQGAVIFVNYDKVTFNTGGELISEEGRRIEHPKPGDRGYVEHDPLCPRKREIVEARGHEYL